MNKIYVHVGLRINDYYSIEKKKGGGLFGFD
jgi:hypothetical protein